MAETQYNEKYPGATIDDLYRTGMGNWSACVIPVDQLITHAATWRSALEGVCHPWLCWNVDPDWCLLTIGGYGGGVARKQYLLKLEEKWANDVENR